MQDELESFSESGRERDTRKRPVKSKKRQANDPPQQSQKHPRLKEHINHVSTSKAVKAMLAQMTQLRGSPADMRKLLVDINSVIKDFNFLQMAEELQQVLDTAASVEAAKDELHSKKGTDELFRSCFLGQADLKKVLDALGDEEMYTSLSSHELARKMSGVAYMIRNPARFKKFLLIVPRLEGSHVVESPAAETRLKKSPLSDYEETNGKDLLQLLNYIVTAAIASTVRMNNPGQGLPLHTVINLLRNACRNSSEDPETSSALTQFAELFCGQLQDVHRHFVGNKLTAEQETQVKSTEKQCKYKSSDSGALIELTGDSLIASLISDIMLYALQLLHSYMIDFVARFSPKV